MEITTKRQVIAQIFVCQGCCCGKVEKGNPAVPVDWMKAEFKRRKLIRRVHLTISGCLGPCDVLNVVALWLPEGMRWFGGLEEFWQYAAIMEWAGASADAGEALPLPGWLLAHEFSAMRPAGVMAVSA